MNKLLTVLDGMAIGVGSCFQGPLVNDNMFSTQYPHQLRIKNVILTFARFPMRVEVASRVLPMKLHEVS